MRQKNIKKLISLQNYATIDLWLKDVSAEEGKNESTVAEEILLGRRPGMLPASEAARNIILNYYDDPCAVAKIFSAAFLHIEGHISASEYDPQADLGLIRSFLSQLYHTDDRISVCAVDKVPLYKSFLREVIDVLHSEGTALRGEEFTRLRQEYDAAALMMRQLHSAPHLVQCHHIISILQSAWDYVSRYPSTYRLLRTQIELLDMPNNPTTRLAALKALHEASAHWPD